jgi:hypothetical protein
VKILRLRDRPADDVARELAAFEERFTYPLGPGRRFTISHGEDYPRFFRAMGEARCFVARRGSEVVGALGVAIRPLVMPDGTRRTVAYVGDLKVAATMRGTLVFLRLAQAAYRWARPKVTAAYGVVMEGTTASPAAYTGRVGIPSFLKVGRILVLRFPTAGAGGRGCGPGCRTVTAAEGEAYYLRLSAGRCAAVGGAPAERSEIAAEWMVDEDGAACGRLEDTRRAKRLSDGEGNEMVSAHLSCFAFASPAAGARVFHAARRGAGALGFPALFVAVDEREAPELERALGGVEKAVAPATIYGAGLDAEAGVAWNVNTAEI